jgi:RIO-like serine/threonine protein kinase
MTNYLSEKSVVDYLVYICEHYFEEFEQLTSKLCINLIKTVQELHKAGFAHLGLCLSSFRITQDGKVQIVDFINAIKVENTNEANEIEYDGKIKGKLIIHYTYLFGL